MEKLIYGFYTRPPFWVGTQSDYIESVLTSESFQKLVDEPVVSFSLHNDIDIKIYKDGFIGFTFNRTQKDSLDETLKLLEYFNAFMFVMYNYINTKHQGAKSTLDPYVILTNDLIMVFIINTS